MCQACGLYELRQYGVTCVQAPRCHHTVIPQCVAPTHSKKKNSKFAACKKKSSENSCLYRFDSLPLL
jgi:hypothetical protein